MAINFKRLDALRRGRGEHQNHLIDGFVAGRVGRREFMRYGSVLGLSLPFLGGVAALVSGPGLAKVARAATPGGTIRVAQIVPAAAINPVTIADGGGITVVSQAAETLVLSGADLTARPVLAESWSPNSDGTVWTFKLRLSHPVPAQARGNLRTAGAVIGRRRWASRHPLSHPGWRSRPRAVGRVGLTGATVPRRR